MSPPPKLDAASLVGDPETDVEISVAGLRGVVEAGPVSIELTATDASGEFLHVVVRHGWAVAGGMVSRRALGLAVQALLDPGPRRVRVEGRVETEPDGIPRIFAELRAVGAVLPRKDG